MRAYVSRSSERNGRSRSRSVSSPGRSKEWLLVWIARLGPVRDPRRLDAHLEAHAREAAERLGCIRCVGAEAHLYVPRGLERLVDPAAPPRDGRRRPARDPPDQIEAHRVAVCAAREPRLVMRARLELRINAEPLEELEHLGAVDQVARGGEVEARLAAAVFGATALDLRVGLAREVGLVV